VKLKNIRIKKYKLLRFYLARYEAYKKSVSSFGISDHVLDELEVSLKKVLFIIYQYHYWNKKILFVGVPYSTNRKFVNLLSESNHTFLPKSVWFKGLLGNKGFISKDFKNLLHYKNFLDMDINPHLIVLFNEENLENLVPEVSKLNIPIIYFGRTVKGVERVTYFVEGRFFTKNMKDFYQFLIYSIVKQKTKNNGIL